jgi:hypothetical protein
MIFSEIFDFMMMSAEENKEVISQAKRGLKNDFHT